MSATPYSLDELGTLAEEADSGTLDDNLSRAIATIIVIMEECEKLYDTAAAYHTVLAELALSIAKECYVVSQDEEGNDEERMLQAAAKAVATVYDVVAQKYNASQEA